MQRIACLSLVLFAACGGGGTETGEASLSNTMPAAKSSAAKPFTGADGAGNMVLGWKIEFYADSPGTGCLDDVKKVATIGIYTNKTTADGPHAMLAVGGISIVTEAPPTVLGNAAANVSMDGVEVKNGLVSITEYHLAADAKHADRITGTINAGGTDTGAGTDVTIDGTFTAPVCEE